MSDFIKKLAKKYESKGFCVGQKVQFKNPEPGEEEITYEIAEDNGDRVVIRAVVGRGLENWRIKPTQTVRTSDLELA